MYYDEKLCSQRSAFNCGLHFRPLAEEGNPKDSLEKVKKKKKKKKGKNFFAFGMKIGIPLVRVNQAVHR